MIQRLKIHAWSPLILPAALIGLIVILVEFINPLAAVDQAIIQAIIALPNNLTPATLFFTEVGSVPVAIAVAVVFALAELVRRNYIRTLAMLMSILALPAFYLVKESVQRARPVGDYIISAGLHGYSFPSGHATASAAVFGMIAVLAYSGYRRPWRYIIPIISLSLILVIGISRVYLGAHYPTDVLGGWLLGLVFVSLLRAGTILVAKKSAPPNETPAETLEDTTETLE